MTSKERRKVKHQLKTNIDSADTYLKLAQAGTLLGASDVDNRNETADTREFLIEQLTKLKEQIVTGCDSIIIEIDTTLSQLK